ncbi:hypothetical protein WJX72_012024 [[Myrmecia] bisecta]|uniref:Uncharacterized protein n=1 Tax=[Myrmecia] bisecta TaxID=41462 RepID=A0AAW1PNU9_9CHLO
MFEPRTAAWLLLCVVGIYASYLTQGVVQEKLSTTRYGAAGERFPELKALNGVQSVACFVWAGLLLLFVQPPRKDQKFPPFTAFWKPAVTNSIGPACGYEALKNISYPAQVLAKSCKMIPVMIMGTLIGGKYYSVLEYGCAAMIAAGISLFASHSSAVVTRKLAAPNAPLGYFLCFTNLMFDGYTNATQDEINKQFRDTTAIYTMCWMNFWCGLYYAVYLFGFSSSGWKLVQFCLQHTDAAWDIALFCLCGAIGQLFIFFTIRKFGSLVNTLITTTRKFFNILLSVVWNGNPLLPQQWVAVGLVFAGLLVSAVTKGKRHQLVSNKTK